MQLNARYQEHVLEQDIAQLSSRISGRRRPVGLRARCTHAYLKALLRDKEESLALLRHRRPAS